MILSFLSANFSINPSIRSAARTTEAFEFGLNRNTKNDASKATFIQKPSLFSYFYKRFGNVIGPVLSFDPANLFDGFSQGSIVKRLEPVDSEKIQSPFSVSLSIPITRTINPDRLAIQIRPQFGCHRNRGGANPDCAILFPDMNRNGIVFAASSDQLSVNKIWLGNRSNRWFGFVLSSRELDELSLAQR